MILRLEEKLERSFGQVLREARTGLGLSQEALAEAAGLHRTYLSQLERGLKSPSLGAIVALARSLGTAPHDLVRQAEQLRDKPSGDSWKTGREGASRSVMS